MITPMKMVLSQKDETVPEDYIPLYSLLSESKYALPTCKDNWCVGEKRLRRMRTDTYKEVKKRYDLCGSKDFARFWNGNLDAINSLGINLFARLGTFQELATAMICFQSTEVSKYSGDKRKVISWGIKDSLYRQYYRSHLEAARTGEPPKEVSLYDAKKKRIGNLSRNPEAKISIMDGGKKRVITLDKNAVYSQFEHWCKLRKLDKRTGLYQAMRLIMEKYPEPDLGELSAYERKCDLDYCEVVIPKVTTEDRVVVKFKMPRNMHVQMSQIIQRYNLDSENIGKPKMTVEKYMIQATNLLNQKSPLKYSNPSLYKKYQEAKEAEMYNERISKL